MDSHQLDRDLAGCRAAHQHLRASLDGLTDDDARSASLLPGWTVGHVLTHLARNADGLGRMLDGAARGEIVAMYDSLESRNADIEAGAGRSAAELVDDVTRSIAALDERLTAAASAGWAGEGLTVMGPVPMAEVPSRRRREVVVHETDLGRGYAADAWPADFVRVELARMQMVWASRRPMGMTDLPPAALAAPDHRRLAWLFGRAEIDGLDPAGVF